jgi:hypothetical protein
LAGKIRSSYSGKQTRKKKWKGWINGLLVLILLLGAYSTVKYSSELLITHDETDHIPYLLILEGQGADMERTDAGVDLLLKNKVDTVLVSGKRFAKRKNLGDLYVDEMLSQGDVDPTRIMLVRHDALSTQEEAELLIPVLRKMKTDSVWLITRPFASSRAKKIFNSLSGGNPEFFSWDIQQISDDPETWMTFREGRKGWLREMLAYLNTSWELLFSDQIEESVRVSARPVRYDSKGLPRVDEAYLNENIAEAKTEEADNPEKDSLTNNPEGKESSLAEAKDSLEKKTAKT